MPAPSRLAARLRRLFPLYCVLTALVGYALAHYTTFQSDPDGIAYMDIADCLRSHQWAGAINGVWQPLYPAFLALGRHLLHASLQDETRAYQLVNFAIFLLGIAASIVLADSLTQLRDTLHFDPPARTFLLDSVALRYIALALWVIAAQREFAAGIIRPDALLAVFLFAAMAALLRFLASARPAYGAAMGLALGCAFLTKSVAFPFTCAALALLAIFGLRWNRGRMQTTLAAALALACFAAVAGPYIAALSRQRGRLDFGDSGPLNYAWFAGHTGRHHLQPYMTADFGSSVVQLKHPQRELLRSPQILSYAALPYGTNPDWFDPAYWYEGVQPRFRFRFAASRFVHNLRLTAQFLEVHPESLVLFALFSFLSGWPSGRRSRPDQRTHAFWLPTSALALFTWLLYASVDVQDRYLTVAFVPLMLTLFATVRPAASPERPQEDLYPGFALLLAAALALFATTASAQIALEQRNQILAEGLPGGWYDDTMHVVAASLAQLGVRPGDAVACIGTSACLSHFYWARLDGVRILTEISAPRVFAYPFLRDLPNRDQALAIVHAQGARVLVADFATDRVSTSDPFFRNWVQLGNTTFYALPLNLAAQAPLR